MKTGMTGIVLMVFFLALPAVAADDIPTESMSLNYEKAKAKPKKTTDDDSGEKPARNSTKSGKSGSGVTYGPVITIKPKGNKPAPDKKGIAPPPQKGVEPDEIDRK